MNTAEGLELIVISVPLAVAVICAPIKFICDTEVATLAPSSCIVIPDIILLASNFPLVALNNNACPSVGLLVPTKSTSSNFLNNTSPLPPEPPPACVAILVTCCLIPCVKLSYSFFKLFVIVSMSVGPIPSLPGIPWGPWAPCGPSGPASPLGPGGPTGPRVPIEPVSPLSPLTPSFPDGPGGPGIPLSPWGPIGPIGPIGPGSPCSPNKPLSPRGPLSPCIPCIPGSPWPPRGPTTLPTSKIFSSSLIKKSFSSDILACLKDNPLSPWSPFGPCTSVIVVGPGGPGGPGGPIGPLLPSGPETWSALYCIVWFNSSLNSSKSLFSIFLISFLVTLIAALNILASLSCSDIIFLYVIHNFRHTIN